MFDQVHLTKDLSADYEGMNRQSVENFNLRALFGGKKEKKEMTDQEAADLMNRRRQEVKQLQEENGLLDKITVKPGKIKPAYLPKGFSETKKRVREANEKTLFGSLIDTLGNALAGEETTKPWTPEQEAKAKVIGDVTVQGTRSLYTRNEKIVFYTIIALLVIIAVILIIKKNKK